MYGSCRTVRLNEACSRTVESHRGPGATLGIKLEVEESLPRCAYVHIFLFPVVHLHNVGIDMYTQISAAPVFVSWGKEAFIFSDGSAQAGAVLSPFLCFFFQPVAIYDPVMKSEFIC